MPPKMMKRKTIKKMVKKRVVEAIEEYEETRANLDNSRGSGLVNTRGVVAPNVQGCTHKTFMNGKPHPFNETKGVVGLRRWIEKIVHIPLSNGKILEIQGERLKKDPKLLSCIKSDEKPEDIRIVCDFPKVFLDDLSGLPLTILDLLKKENLYAKFSNCEFWLQEIQFIGHVVNRDGIHMDLCKVEAVKNWKTQGLPLVREIDLIPDALPVV
nr:putative reverse transcriptase domain-containing protein [Tanacetum cinerariifolium]